MNGERISFVIPTYNRKVTLLRTLEGLADQSVQDFEVIVSDDGSTDGTQEIVEELVDAYAYEEHDGYRVSEVRNRGSKLVSESCKYIWYIDSDVILNPFAVEAFLELEKDFDVTEPLVVCGRYDWMPPMEVTTQEIFADLKKWVDCKYPWPKRIPPGAEYGGVRTPAFRRNIDPRQNVDWESDYTPILCNGSTLSGNLVIPIEAFVKTGGFDEKIKGQGQDNEFGRHLGAEGFHMIFSDAIIGYHQYHFRDIQAMTESVRETIRYIHKKYDIPFDAKKHLPKSVE